MANDLQLNEFKLRDPVTSLPDGLREPLEKPPGFFRSLRSPLDLWLEESLPASMYQWMTGNTKKKQAQEALNFIKSYPNLKNTTAYQEAERKLKRFGYLLEEEGGEFSFSEFGNCRGQCLRNRRAYRERWLSCPNLLQLPLVTKQLNYPDGHPKSGSVV